MKHLSIVIAVAAIAAVSVSCAECAVDENRDNSYKPLKLSTKSMGFVQKGNTFAFEFIDRINASATEDYIVSPLSMQFLLGMLLDGAAGETEDEICKVLGYGKGEKGAVDEYSLSMLGQLRDIDKQTTLSIANALFADKAFPIKDSYRTNVGQYYMAEVSNLDFSNAPEALDAINGWCSRNTGNMIPKVLDAISPVNPVYLFNALYFKGMWKAAFNVRHTSKEKFTDESGARFDVMMMRQTKPYAYTETDVFQAVGIPYGNGAFSMVALLPWEGYKVADVIDALKVADWDAFRHGMIDADVDLRIPRFQTTYHTDVSEFLSSMGMPLSFDEVRADFSSMSDKHLCLDFIFQDAIIKVDEEGTEAAVISSSGMLGAAEYDNRSKDFHANRTFLYLIVEQSTGAILFAGRYSGK